MHDIEDDTQAPTSVGTATYSPEDNKVRLYPFHRLPAETYARVKSAGFIWAPKQGLFVAPAWTPQREDLLLELCGDIEDEDTSLVERAEARADRFEGYHERRRAEADRAQATCRRHRRQHPPRAADPRRPPQRTPRRKDAERIENGMRRTVRLWETANYWTRRAPGAIPQRSTRSAPTCARAVSRSSRPSTASSPAPSTRAARFSRSGAPSTRTPA